MAAPDRADTKPAASTPDRTATMVALTTQLATALSLDVVAQVTVELTGQLLAARNVGLWTTDPDNGTARLVHSLGYTPAMHALFDHVSPAADLPLAEALRSAEPRWYDSRAAYAAAFPNAEPATRAASNLRDLAFACLPLVVHDRVVGALAITFDDGTRLGAEDRALLLVISGHAAHALERVRLFGTERRARERAERLQWVAASLTSALTPTDVGAAVIDGALDTIGAAGGSLFVAEGGGGEMQLIYRRAVSASEVPITSGEPERSSRPSEAVGDGLPTVDRVEALHASFASGADSARACLPLVVREQVLGVVTIDFARPHPFDASDRDFLSTLASLAAQAIERARLFEAERRAREHITRLQQLTAALSPAVTVDDVARVVVEQTMATLGASAGGVWLESSLAPELSCRCVRGSPVADQFPVLSIDAPVPIAVAARTGTPVYVESFGALEHDYSVVARWLQTRGITACSIAATPLRFGDRRGALVISFGDGRKLHRDEQPFLDAIARQTGIALERADLFESEVRSSERHRLLAEASATLGSTLDYEQTLRNVVNLVVPRLADFAFFDVRQGDTVRRTPLARDPAKQAILNGSQWVRSERTDVNLCALSSGEIGFHPRMDAAFLEFMAASPEHLAVLRRLELCAMLTLPLYSRGRLIAALTLCMGESGRAYSPDDLEAATELVRRAAMALDNAQLFRDLEEAVALRDEFLAIASHELNTPLTALSLSLTRARGVSALPSNVTTAIERAARQSERLATLVTQLLDVSRVSSGRFALQVSEVDLAELVRDAAERLEDERKRAGSVLELRVPSSLVGEWDALRIDQVVTNLLTNAIKYGRGQPIAVAVTEVGDEAVIVVRDRGIGIAAEDRERIFGRFERAVSIKHFGGFGLGLWITRQIVDASGGRITVDSRPGEGATFTVALPRRARDARSGPASS